jgi:signal transduction histidine kinase
VTNASVAGVHVGTPLVAGSRPRLRAALISLGCALLGATGFLVNVGWDLEQAGGALSTPRLLLLPVDVLLGLAASIAVGPVRGSRGGNVAVVLAGAVSVWALPAWIVSTVRLGARRSTGSDVAVVVVFTTATTLWTWFEDTLVGRPSTDLALIAGATVVITVAVLLVGRVRGTRAALVVALRNQAASAELALRSADQAHRSSLRSREAEIAAVRAEERSAIARDMHDGISHQLAIVAMHAGALAHRTDLTADQQRQAAGTVRRAAADASVLLRDALRALRDPDDTRPTTPLPGAASIDRLVDAVRTAGHPVDLVWEDTSSSDLDQVPGRSTTCVRILEELLMNARKHAPSAPVSVVLAAATPSGITLRVSNPLPGPADRTDDTGVGLVPIGTGLGLVGVVERAEAVGGSAAHGPTDAGTFAVEVHLP